MKMVEKTRYVGYLEFDASTSTEMLKILKGLLDLGFAIEVVPLPNSERQFPEYSRIWFVIKGSRKVE